MSVHRFSIYDVNGVVIPAFVDKFAREACQTPVQIYESGIAHMLNYRMFLGKAVSVVVTLDGPEGE